jgi:EmrB/QacA subfamily drug resistance transporter
MVERSPARAAPSLLALVVILCAQLMVVLDFSIVNVALPSIARDLGLAAGTLEWVVTAYAITFGGLLILGGRAGDIVGRRRLFLAGLTVFSIASLLGAFAASGAQLVLARAAQGVGAALIAPTALALVATSFPEGPARNRALGLYGATASVGFVAGLVLGGILVTVVGWRAVLWVNVPIGIVTVVLGRMSLPPDRRIRAGDHLDLVGAILVTLAMAVLAYLPMVGSAAGWRSTPTVRGALLAALLLAAFVSWELHHANPLVRLGIFRKRTLSAANGIILLFGAWNAGQLLVLALCLQHVLGYTPLQAGFAMVPQGLAGFSAGLLGARCTDRLGIRGVLLLTTALGAVGHLLLSLAVGYGGFLAIELALIPVGVGNGGTAFAATVAGSTGVADLEQGLAGGLLNTSRQMGSALGVTALMAVATAVASSSSLPGEGYRAALVVAAGLAAVAFVVSAAFVRTRRADQPSLVRPVGREDVRRCAAGTPT